MTVSCMLFSAGNRKVLGMASLRKTLRILEKQPWLLNTLKGATTIQSTKTRGGDVSRSMATAAAAAPTATSAWVKHSTPTCHGLSTAISPADVQLNRLQMDADEDTVLKFFAKNEEARLAWTYSRSFGMSTEDTAQYMNVMLGNRMHSQLKYSEDQLRHRHPKTDKIAEEKASIQAEEGPSPPLLSSLPRTLEQAQQLHSSPHAMVITVANHPFTIHDVNGAWEGLCGYTCNEARGKAIGDLLKGPDTDQIAATALIRPLMYQQLEYHFDTATTVTTTLTNYTKEGRRFRNQVQVGPLTDQDGTITHFVGILREIHDGM